MHTRVIYVLLLVACLGATGTKINAQEPDEATKANIEQRDQLWEEAVTLAKSGELDKAAQVAERVLKLEETIFGNSHEELTGTLLMLGQIAEARKAYDVSVGYFERFQTITEKLYGAEDSRTKGAVRMVTEAKRIVAMTPEERAQFESTNSKIEQRDLLQSEAMAFAESGNFDKATELTERVYQLEQTILGDSHADLLGTLDFLCRIAQAKKDYDAIIGYRQRQQVIIEKLHGAEDYRTKDAARAVTNAKQIAAMTLDDRDQIERRNEIQIQVMQAFQEGNYAAGIKAATECMSISEKVLGKQHNEYATTLINLALLYHAMGDPLRAEPLLLEAIMIKENVLGKQHPDYAITLLPLAAVYREKGDSVRAESLSREAIAIQERVLGKQHPDYATSLNSLATLFELMADYPRAETLYREAIAIQEKALGKQHPDYATCLNNLAALYYKMSDYTRAEPLYRDVMAIDEKVLGKDHPSHATSLNNLALLYIAMNDYQRAEHLFHQATEIREKLLGKDHPDYATSLHSLAGMYRKLRDYQRAEPLFRQAIEIRKNVLGKDHPDYARSLHDLAMLYCDMTDFSRAEPMLREAIAIREQVQGKSHPDYAQSLNGLAMFYYETSDYQRAEPLFRLAVEVLGNVFGKEHPYYAVCLNNLAALYFSMGKFPLADTLFREVTEITLRNLELTADAQSQRQQMQLGESLRHQLDNYLSLATREPRFQEVAYAALLRWKGSVWQRQQRQRLLLDQPELKPRFEQLQSVSSRLSTLTLNPPAPERLEAWRRQLDELTQKREDLERDLSLASVEFRQSTVPVTPEQLRASLPAGTMLVDFLVYNRFTPANKEQQTKESWEEHLLVHLVRADQEIRAIDLGPVDSLNEWVQTWRRDFGQSREASEAAGKLRERIWLPIEEHLADVHTVYVSPDGVLGQFPLAALPGKNPGSYLLEELAIVMLPVPQGLPAMSSPPSSTAAAVDKSSEDRFCLVGDVDYEKVAAPSDKPAPDPTAPTSPLLLATRGGQWQTFNALPGTSAEINTIESMLWKYRPTSQATILRGGSATEAEFARIAPGQRYLHIATHGFFAPETVKNALAASSSEPNRMLSLGDSRPSKPLGQHPDLLSGLVFAGANQEPVAGADDGILTAAEVHSLDLRSVDLAVLSACETGLGQTAGGEGIIGLQRAFQLAGARTTVTSLWQVDDAATQALMVEFYRNLFEKKLSKLESLRQAQIWMLNNPTVIKDRDLTTRGKVREIKPITPDTPTEPAPNRSLPAYWAAFQLSGDPR
jgi:CHAT domain-containing protein/Tfp pilus assembly protein PilF